jgi:hypothetical protein
MTEENKILVANYENYKNIYLNVKNGINEMDIEIQDGEVEFEVEIDLCYGSARERFHIPLYKLKEMINKYEEITK